MKSRLAIAASLALFATAATAASDIVMHRDPGCGCCEKWAMQVKAAFGRNVQKPELARCRNELVRRGLIRDEQVKGDGGRMVWMSYAIDVPS